MVQTFFFINVTRYKQLEIKENAVKEKPKEKVETPAEKPAPIEIVRCPTPPQSIDGKLFSNSLIFYTC